MQEQQTTVHADNHSIAAGGDVNIDQLNVELRTECLLAHLAPYADMPGAITCSHCHVRGLSPNADRCTACGEDVGAPRRLREAAAARRRWWLRRLGDVRLATAFTVATLAVSMLLYAYPGILGDQAATTAGGLLAIVVVTALLEQGIIGVEVWLQYTVPRWLRAHGLGWVTGRPY